VHVSVQSTFSLASNVTFYDIVGSVQSYIRACKSPPDPCHFISSLKPLHRGKQHWRDCDGRVGEHVLVGSFHKRGRKILAFSKTPLKVLVSFQWESSEDDVLNCSRGCELGKQRGMKVVHHLEFLGQASFLYQVLHLLNVQKEKPTSAGQNLFQAWPQWRCCPHALHILILPS